MKATRFSKKIALGPGQNGILRRARATDRDSIRQLYNDVYGGGYPLPLIQDPKQTLATLKDPNHFWLVVEHEKRLVSSVLFACDQADRIGKVYGAVVRPEYRGHHLTQHSIGAGLNELLANDKPLELFYATTRTVTPAPAKLVTSLGFIPCGVFPNVHRVAKAETHGLHVYFPPQAFRDRLQSPRLIPQVHEFFQIAQQTLNLPDNAVIEPIELPPPSRQHFTFTVVDDPPLVEKTYQRRLESGRLRFSFFPFHEPHVLCHTKNQADEVFIHYNASDGYGAILGIKTDEADFVGFLDQLCEALHSLGLRYIELLVSAFDPLKQRQALAARFLPCAYFPAMKADSSQKRVDYIVFSRSFESLDFTGLDLEGPSKRYLQAFVRCWYGMMVAQAPDFSDVDQLF